jgi:hypothetical protein
METPAQTESGWSCHLLPLGDGWVAELRNDQTRWLYCRVEMVDGDAALPLQSVAVPPGGEVRRLRLPRMSKSASEFALMHFRVTPLALTRNTLRPALSRTLEVLPPTRHLPFVARAWALSAVASAALVPVMLFVPSPLPPLRLSQITLPSFSVPALPAPSTPAPKLATPAPEPTGWEMYREALTTKNYDKVVFLADKAINQNPQDPLPKDLKAYAAVRKNPQNLAYAREVIGKTGTLQQTASPRARAVHSMATAAVLYAEEKLQAYEDAQAQAGATDADVATLLRF